MIVPVVERTIVVRDSDPDDESRFTIYVRDAVDVEQEDGGRHVMLPEGVWLTLDDTEQLGRELIALAQALREEREPAAEEPKPVAKKTAARKRPARKATA